MRINYFLPFILPPEGVSGGIGVILEQVRRLRGMGHDATLTIPDSQIAKKWSETEYVIAIDRPERMPDADVIVATASESVPIVWEMPPSKGAKFYLVQGYESLWCGNVDWTYRLPMTKIVVSRWLERVMAESFEQESIVINPAIDHETFRPPETSDRNGRRVLVLDHHTRIIKGTYVAIGAVELARRRVPDLELVVFGLDPDDDGFSRVAEVHRHPTGADLARLYGSCDVFLYPTLADGFPLPPLEAMACGTPAVTTTHAGTGDWANDDVCYTVPVHDVAATADALVRALSDDAERARIAEAGMRTAAQFTWDRTMSALEKALGQA